MSCFHRIFAAALLPISMAVPASAITVTFNVAVTESSISLPDVDDGPTASLPALGTALLGTAALRRRRVSRTA